MSASAHLGDLAVALDRRVRTEQIRLLYAQAPLGVAAGLLIAPLLALLIQHYFLLSHLLIWLFLLELSYLGRLALSIVFQRHARANHPEPWATAYAGACAINGACWGGCVLLLAQSPAPWADWCILMILGAVLLGAIFSLSASLTVYTAYALPLSLPSILWLLLQPEAIQVTIGVVSLIYLLLALATAWRLHQTLCHSLQLAAENLTLAHCFAQAKEQTEANNQKLSRQRTALRDCVQAMRALHQVISTPHRHTAERIEALLAMGCARFGLSVGLLSRANGEHCEITHRIVLEPTITPDTLFWLAEAYCGKTLRVQAPLHFTHAPASRDGQHSTDPNFRLESYLGAPVYVDGRIYGALGFAGSMPRAPFTAAERGLVQLMAQWVGSVLKQERMAETAQQQQVLLAHASRLQSLGEMASGLVHEINQPVTAIALYAEAGLSQARSQQLGLGDAREILEKILTQSGRATALVQRIRHFARQSKPHYATIHISAILEDMASFLRLETRRHQVDLRCAIAPDLPLVRADVLQVQQVILNLVRNALEAMANLAGSPTSCIMISAQTAVHEVIIAVRDSGAGLSPDALEALPRPFFTTKPDGLGLGLAISQSIIEAHGGRLWATANQVGPGVTFCFSLPTVDATISRLETAQPLALIQ